MSLPSLLHNIENFSFHHSSRHSGRVVKAPAAIASALMNRYKKIKTEKIVQTTSDPKPKNGKD